MKFNHCKSVSSFDEHEFNTSLGRRFDGVKEVTAWISGFAEMFDLTKLVFSFQKQGEQAAYLSMIGDLPARYSDPSNTKTYPDKYSVFNYVEKLYASKEDLDIFEKINHYHNCDSGSTSKWFFHLWALAQKFATKSYSNPVVAAYETILTWTSQGFDYEVYLSFGQICYHKKTPSSQEPSNKVTLKAFFQPPHLSFAANFFNKTLVTHYSFVTCKTVLKYFAIKKEKYYLEDEEYFNVQYEVKIRELS